MSIVEKNIPILFLLGIALLFSFYKLDKLPLPVNQDELSNIYDGYSIAKTGAERHGHKYPFIVEGFGSADNRPALYAWLCAVPQFFTGFNVFAGRSISAFLFVCCVLLIYKIGLLLYDNRFAFLASVVFIFTPWSWCYARLAHEGGMLPPFFVLAILYGVITIFKNKNFKYFPILLLGFIIGFSTNAYQSTRLIGFLCFVTIFIYFLKYSFPQKTNKIIVFSLASAIGAFPQIYTFIFQNHLFIGRYESSKIQSTGMFNFLYIFFKNILANCSPSFLFFQFEEQNLCFEQFLKIEFLFFYIGILFVFFQLRKNKLLYFVLLLSIITLIPNSITKDNCNALRLSGFLALGSLFISFGIWQLLLFIKNKNVQYGFLSMVVIIIPIAFTFTFINFKNNIYTFNNGQQYQLVEMTKKLKPYYQSADSVFIEDMGNQPYIYVLAFCNILPSFFQKCTKNIDNSDIWSKVISFDKCRFMDISTLQIPHNNFKKNIVLVSSSQIKGFTPFDSIVNEHQKIYYSRANIYK